MNADNSRPRLRALEVTLTEHEDQDAVLLRDPLHMSEAILVVPMGLVPVLKRMDGAHTLADIRRECLAEEKIDFPEENIRELFSHLEQSHFLDGDGFEAWRRMWWTPIWALRRGRAFSPEKVTTPTPPG